MISQIFNPTGGLLYHWKAWCFNKAFWGPFQKSIEQWLIQEWDPQVQELVLIGPSAGYQLPDSFLTKFQKVSFYEQDAFAIFLLKRRLKKLSIPFESHCQVLEFADPDELLLGGIRRVIEAHPNAAFLFCNILGQLPIVHPDFQDSQWVQWSLELAHVLHKKQWASFHDVYSSAVEPHLKKQYEPHEYKDANAFLEEIFGKTLKQNPKKIEVMDHRFLKCFPHHRHRFFLWQIQPDYFHCVVGVSQNLSIESK